MQSSQSTAQTGQHGKGKSSRGPLAPRISEGGGPAGTPRRSTSAARPFLTEGLFRRVMDFSARLLSAIARTCICLKGDDDLVHKRFVKVTTENRIRRGKCCRGLTFIVQELDIHGLGSFFSWCLDGRAHNDAAALIEAQPGPEQRLFGLVDSESAMSATALIMFSRLVSSFGRIRDSLNCDAFMFATCFFTMFVLLSVRGLVLETE